MSLKEPRYHLTSYAHCYSYHHIVLYFTAMLFHLTSRHQNWPLSIQLNHDLGCRASLVETIEEGVNAQSPAAAEFWKILGGPANYHCMYPKIDRILEFMIEFMCYYLN